MILHEFTQPEIDFFLEKCNFTDLEKQFFLCRTQGHTLDEIPSILPMTRRTADNYSRRVKKKILKVL